MKIVILKTGEIKEVSDGYARNYLLPQKLAIPATTESIKQAEAKQAAIKAELAARQKKEEESLAQLKDKTVEIKTKANEEGKLFAAVAAADVKKSLAEQLAIEFPVHYFQFEPIKELGARQVDLVTDFKVKTKLALKITKEE